MYVIAILRYRRNLDEVLTLLDPHRAYLRDLQARGILLASGPFEPRAGGALLLRLPEGTALEELDRLRDGDPFVRAGMAQYEILPWNPSIGRETLDAMESPVQDGRR